MLFFFLFECVRIFYFVTVCANNENILKIAVDIATFVTVGIVKFIALLEIMYCNLVQCALVLIIC